MKKTRADIRWSTIGRSISLRVPSNLAVAVLTLVAFLVGLVATLLFRGETWPASTLLSLGWAGAVFLSWALAREVDPDRWYSAFFAAAGGFTAALMFSPPPLLTIFWLLIALRFINRSTGHQPGVLDVAFFCALSIWLGWSTHWMFPLLALPAILLAGKRLAPALTQMLVGIAIAACGAALGIVRNWALSPLDPVEGFLEIRVVVAVTLASMMVIHSYRNVRSRADRTGEPLEPQRVQWALTWAISVGIILTLGAGMPFEGLSPLWAALAGTALGWGLETLLPLVRKRRA